MHFILENKTRIGITLAIVLGVLILGFLLKGVIGGIFDEDLKEGIITSKEHQEAETSIALTPMIVPGPNNTSTTIMIPYTIYDDEDYILHLENCEESTDGRKCETGKVYVDQNTYEAYAEGEFFGDTGEGAIVSTEDPDKKTKRDS